MTELTSYLMYNYYSKYKGGHKDVVPSIEQIENGYKNYPDHFLIIKDDKIRGVAVFVTLCDKTVETLCTLNINRVDVINKLLLEQGRHVHFLLLCADGMITILRGIRELKKKVNPKTISWWNPDLTKLHTYKVREPCLF